MSPTRDIEYWWSLREDRYLSRCEELVTRYRPPMRNKQIKLLMPAMIEITVVSSTTIACVRPIKNRPFRKIDKSLFIGCLIERVQDVLIRQK